MRQIQMTEAYNKNNRFQTGTQFVPALISKPFGIIKRKSKRIQ
jgi:hypothetical protein